MREKRPKIIFLMETKQTVDEMRKLKEELHYQAGLVVPCDRSWGGRRGGLAMLWKDDVELHIQTYSPHHIDAIIQTHSGSPWRITGFYGYPEECHKHESWILLRHLHSRMSLPWVCIGDYNEILSSDEKQERLEKAFSPMLAFRNTLAHCELIDMGFQGGKFTWNNGRPGVEFVQERIDKACANQAWRDLFPRSQVFHLSVSYSDHIPIMLTIQASNEVKRKKNIPRRFEEKWASHPKCRLVVEEGWRQRVEGGSPMFCLFQRIRNTRLALIKWEKRAFGNTKVILQQKQRLLEELTCRNDPTLLERIRETKAEINNILHHEELAWKQRSRAIWLPAGDKNIKFFHQRAT